jgi:hypothetical protein
VEGRKPFESANFLLDSWSDFDRRSEIWTAVHHANTNAVYGRERKVPQAGLQLETGKDVLQRLGVAGRLNSVRAHNFLVFVDEKLRIRCDRFHGDTGKRDPFRGVSLRSVAPDELDLEGIAAGIDNQNDQLISSSAGLLPGSFHRPDPTG